MLIPRTLLVKKHNDEKSNKINNLAIDISSKIADIQNYCVDNPEVALSLLGLLFSGRHIIRSLIVSHRVNKENRRRDYTYYDPHTGFRYCLSRKLTNDDYLEISRRTKNGENVYDILFDLRAIV